MNNRVLAVVVACVLLVQCTAAQDGPLMDGLSEGQKKKINKVTDCVAEFVQDTFNSGMLTSGLTQFGDFTMKDQDTADDMIRMVVETAAAMAILISHHGGMLSQELMMKALELSGGGD